MELDGVKFVTSQPHSDVDNLLEATDNNKSFSKLMQKYTGEEFSEPNSNSIDFTNSTRLELFNWMNGKIKSGEMTLDQSFPFMAMTLKMPASNKNSVAMLSDGQKVNFIDKAENGLKAAELRCDGVSFEMLSSALKLMNAANSSC
ncbi:hypothetical protein [Bowmanella denitrificans]|uniref:hypothetical protein n=1 Tax=Bowmanella denitrificans TaxID=366582 RepID=UPI000C9C8114|nr:hypothetical protein [Bowmanella denitrificans]